MADPVPMWPVTLPQPQAPGFAVESPPRVETADVLYGTTRMTIKARTAPMRWSFQFWFTPEQHQIFEEFYRNVLENFDGEFYARWVGGSRVVAFSAPYEYSPLGEHWVLSGSVIRTRIDHSVCDEFISTIFGALYQADLASLHRYQADLTAPDLYQDNFSLTLIAENEC